MRAVYNSVRLIGNFTGWTKPYWRLASLGMCCLLISSGLTLLWLSLIRQTVVTFPQLDLQRLVELGLALIARSVFGFWGVAWLGRVAARALSDARQKFFAAFLRAPVSFHDEHWSADLVATLTTDATFIQEALGRVLPTLALHVPTATIITLLLLVENGPLTVGLALAGLPLVLFILIAGRALRQMTQRGLGVLAQTAIIAQESLLGLRLIKTLTREDFFIGRFVRISEAHFVLKYRRVLCQATIDHIVPVAAAAIALWGFWLAQRQLAAGETTPGQLATFAAYLLVLGASAVELVRVYTSIEPMVGAAQRIVTVQRAVAASEVQAGQPIERGPGAIDFRSVSFHYPHRRGGIHDISLQIEPGEIVAMVGPNGAGKSTLIHLLLRFYQPQGGCIRLDGHCADEVDMAAWRQHFALVTRDPVIFSLSLAENIALGRPAACETEIVAAAQAVRLHDFIQSLPNGYAAQVGEAGVKLSAGQRQRLALARVFLQNPSVVIFDEATTSLDSESEAAFIEAINQWAGSRTIIFISHRPETFGPITRLIRVEAGRIVNDTNTRD